MLLDRQRFFAYNAQNRIIYNRKLLGEVMASECIIVRTSKYFNCYIARPSFRCNRVIAHGKDAGKVRQMAIRKGYKRPVIVFSPPKNAICLY